MNSRSLLWIVASCASAALGCAATSAGCTVYSPPGYAELTQAVEPEEIPATTLRMFGCAPWSYDLPDGSHALIRLDTGASPFDDVFSFRVSAAGTSLKCEANAPDAYKQAIVDGDSDDIVYSNLFTGVHGNYLAPSIRAAGLDPDHLPVSDPSQMNFGGDAKKAWKDIWGCGQGIGAIDAVLTAGELVARLAEEYEAAKAELAAKTALTSGAPLAFAAE